jgi:hypothetical protein
MKIIELNKEKYVLKKEYDKLKEKKVKIIESKKEISFEDIAIKNDDYTCGIINLSDFSNNVLKKQGLDFCKVFTNKLKFLESKTEEFNEFPIVKINETIYDFRYFIQAVNIANALNIDNEYKIKITGNKNKPLLLEFSNFGFLIAPRVELEDIRVDSDDIE